MCGRTACTLAPDDIVAACVYTDPQGNNTRPQWRDPPGGHKYKPSGNIAPSAHCPVLVSSSHLQSLCPEVMQGQEVSEEGQEVTTPGSRLVTPMKWGLTPPWHTGDPYKVPFETNNCRMEGMMDKKTYKVPLQRGNRCVILMDGFYEWNTTKSGKQPYFFHFPQPKDFSFDCKKIKLDKYASLLLKDSKCDSNTDIKKEEISSTPPSCKTDSPTKQEICDSTIKLDQSDQWNESDKKTVTDTFAVKDAKESDITDSFVSGKRKLSSSLEIADETRWVGQRLLTVAGVYDVWRDPSTHSKLLSYSVITVPASQEFSWCHHRMPAVLHTEEEVNTWLNVDGVPLGEACQVIRPTEGLSHYAVNPAVGNSRYQEPDCVLPWEPKKPKPSASSNFMMNWIKGDKKTK